MSYYATINPATGERVCEFDRATEAEIDAALANSAAAYHGWRAVPLAERADILRRIAKTWREQTNDLAPTLTVELGKPVAQARAEVSLCADIFDYYADQGPAFLEDEVLSIAAGGTAVVRTEPIGPLMGVMPWNFPYYQVVRFAAPNLLLGNTIVIKHSRNCPQSALAISRMFADAGLPGDVYVNVFADSTQVGRMVADSRIRGVSLTGSERAGSAVAEIAGRHMKKFVLELGGSDPFIVLDDSDLDSSVAAAVNNRLYNAGQACTASKRFLVLDQVYDRFLDKFTRAMDSVNPGDPTDPATTLGPLSSRHATDELAEQVDDAIDKGATLLTGGRRSGDADAAYEPTVLAGVTPDMRAYHEELFGPVAVVHRVRDEEDAIVVANESPFGLGAAVFTGDPQQGRRVAERLDVGMVWINGTSKSSPDLPFGGAKCSGVGRELGRFGIDEFANKKLIRTVR
ncbi:NAD-dependent succinate-semialdehyde dehydrogenase [Rhodococcus sp. JVH1]|uniref:NAD-dependent succinate-semialdehyde dehydrogenase n=1 Tax=Rhodococcus sp. JVH1 TaxID=745408 RepID=UPI0002720DA6|nr:NAD-dependent succinate-semialdehyde dehydrogenase [Rhodococcus sp. JVH1]EJI98351.1 aldehyde dehydrogenase-like protein yneI [Rhodococcus sp. JVH1]